MQRRVPGKQHDGIDIHHAEPITESELTFAAGLLHEKITKPIKGCRRLVKKALFGCFAVDKILRVIGAQQRWIRLTGK